MYNILFELGEKGRNYESCDLSKSKIYEVRLDVDFLCFYLMNY